MKIKVIPSVIALLFLQERQPDFIERWKWRHVVLHAIDSLWIKLPKPTCISEYQSCFYRVLYSCTD